MDTTSKVRVIKTLLDIPQEDTTLDNEISVYLDMAASEILNWMYINKPSRRSEVTAVPQRYEMVQLEAVTSGYNHKGAEGEKVHNENGINRTFMYDDMIAYIRTHVFQII